jgi:aminoglycoside phosphotransferase family enzyme
MPRQVIAPLGNIGLDAKIAFLMRPGSYPEHTTAVEAKETHMSWVFLTDNHAYKLKKPVRYSFLDFSTVEARRRNCEEEVRLNRRLAADVYLGTLALTVDSKGGLHLGGAGQPIDWLVKMRRMPAERTLEHAIAAGTVTQADICHLAEQLSLFYGDADRVQTSPESYRRRFEREVRSNREELSRPLFALPSDTVDALAASQLRFLAAHGAFLEDRARSGRIVEAHGDLRPEHVYLGERPVVVDCLEFNREYRILDPADELAYLAMECDRLHAPFVGACAFDVYRNRTHDDPPWQLVEFYKCCRAYLRAKIAIWHLDEPQMREPAKWAVRAGEYLSLARDYSERLG